ncbi:MAG: hypothetical protein ABSG96_13535 [Terracidiphilus sp.]|jgi:hypothetical protein
MKEYNEFHDGWFEGLWIEGETAYVFLATHEHERFVFCADGVAELTVDGVKSSNIIFEVLVRDPDEVVLQDLKTLYPLRGDSAAEAQAANLFEKVRLQKWRIQEINPSYGAGCLILASSFDLLRCEDWLKQFERNDLPA